VSYLNRVNPNLALILQFLSKTAWLVLAGLFGYIGFRLYALGVTATGGAKVKFLGVDISLDNAGPGLVVMVVALLCALVGAVRTKIVMTPDSVQLSAHKPDSEHVTVVGISEVLKGVGIPDVLNDLEVVWGLTEVAMLRVPIRAWADDVERARIHQIQHTEPLPVDWVRQLTNIARLSPGFSRFLRTLSSHVSSGLVLENLENADRLKSVDFSLPWCARLRWGARNSENVDLFVCATGGAAGVKWYTIKAS
jgi:hypothetical protein